MLITNKKKMVGDKSGWSHGTTASRRMPVHLCGFHNESEMFWRLTEEH